MPDSDDPQPTQAPTDRDTPVSTNRAAYNGFIAGIFSGMAKLAVGHPFDTIKVRLQTTPAARFTGPVDCVRQTFRAEGVRGFYKGATPPLVGWMFMDSLMLGSLTLYKSLLREHVFAHPAVSAWYAPTQALAASAGGQAPRRPLPIAGHAVAGSMAGWTVSFLAAPVEHVKARLQVQYAASKERRLYRGPVDCVAKILRTHGIYGLFRGLPATIYFRSFFCVWWSSYEWISRLFATHTALSQPAINFWAGGLSAQLFWLSSYPADVVKQRLMTDPLGGRLGDGQPQFRGKWVAAARDIRRRDGWKGYWRGFGPCFLRAFPANAMALLVFEGVMRTLSP